MVREGPGALVLFWGCNEYDKPSIEQSTVLCPNWSLIMLDLRKNKGRPVLIYRLGATDIGALRMEFPDVLMQQLHVQLYEFVLRIALPACSLAAGRHIDQVTTVVDLEGMGMLALPKVKELLMPSLRCGCVNVLAGSPLASC
eukprot:358302-Chlamydomonas_euryale.AAC.7